MGPECKNGYWKRILRVKLDTGEHWAEDIPEEFLKDYLGGRGLGIKMLSEEIGPGVDPLSPINPIIILTGPFTGTPFPTASRAVMVTLSPLTGIYLYSVAGGKFGRALKKAGYDGVVIEGEADRQSVLVIKNDTICIENMEELTGLEVTPTVERVRAKYGHKLSVAVIGPAGEKLVKFAAVTTDDHRSFGRGGIGAVMGAKKLKVIAVAGDLVVTPINKEVFSSGLKKLMANLKECPGPRKEFPIFGTADGPALLSGWGIFPTKNWSKSTFEKAEKISMPYLREEGNFVRRDTGCHSCPVRCGKEMYVENGEFAGAWNEGPEYETLYALGSNLGIDSAEFIIAANQRCDELGLDTMSAGVTIGFAMECFERGIINSSDTGGLELKFGNYLAAYQLIEDIALRQGIGELLAEGTRTASKQLGNGSEKFAMHCKGMELGGYDPRGSFGQAVVYAAGNRGGCHHSIGLAARKEMADGSRFETENKGILVRTLARGRIVQDSMPCCTFAINFKNNLPIIAKMLTGLTGWTWEPERLLEMGDRINTLERSFNCRLGYSAKDDVLPERLFEDPLPDGPAQGKVVSRDGFQEMLKDYYQALGWNPITGIPTNVK